jgi:hypothetical protein
MDPKNVLDKVEKRKFLILKGLELGLLGRQARSDSVYRLSYPGSRLLVLLYINSISSIKF